MTKQGDCRSMTRGSDVDQFPIRVISELSGVPATTLRAWERRYGLLKPQRTPSGHRLYTREDLEVVRLVVRLLDANHPIREAAKMIREGGAEAQIGTPDGEHWQNWIRRLLRAVADFNPARVEGVYNEALSTYPMDLVSERLIEPTLRALGERWQSRDSGIAEEHFFSAWLRNKLGARLHHEASRPRGRQIVAACPEGEHHELGLLLFCLAAMGHGYRILYLGANAPCEQLASVAERSDSQGILLSLTHKSLDEDQLARLIADAQVPVMLGGSEAVAKQSVIEACGGYLLGSDRVQALATLERMIPAHAPL
jgi:DNA-binding transcriptional MerR regulator